MESEVLKKFIAPGDKDEYGNVYLTQDEHECFVQLSQESELRKSFCKKDTDDSD